MRHVLMVLALLAVGLAGCDNSVRSGSSVNADPLAQTEPASAPVAEQPSEVAATTPAIAEPAEQPETVSESLAPEEPVTVSPSVVSPAESPTEPSGPQLVPPQTGGQGAAAKLLPLDWKGTEELVAQQRGKVVVLNIWTTTCLTCLRELPEIVSLPARHPDEVACITVNCDFDGIPDKPPEFYRAQVLEVLRKHPGANHNVLLTIPFIDILKQLDLNSTPAVIVYDREGQLVKRFDNDDATRIDDEFTHADVAAFVAELIADKP